MLRITILFIIGLCVVFVAGYVLGLIENWRVRRRQIIKAEYEAPNLLTPAELGYLVDRRFGNNEVLATIVSLVQNDALRLSKHEPSNPLVVLKEASDDTTVKRDYAEITVLSWLKQNSLGSVSLRDLTNLTSKHFGRQADFEEEVRRQLIAKGYIDKHQFFSALHGKYLWWISALLTVTLTVAAWGVYHQSVRSTSLNSSFRAVEDIMGVALFLPLILVAWIVVVYLCKLVLYVFFAAAGKPSGLTPLFKKYWRDVAGFQEYIKTVEFSRLDADTNPKDKLMPYAIALGFKPNIDKLSERAEK